MKRTFQPNNHKKKKVHGFFARKLADTGILNKRRAKNYQHNSTYLCISGFLLLEVHLWKK